MTTDEESTEPVETIADPETRTRDLVLMIGLVVGFCILLICAGYLMGNNGALPPVRGG